MDFDLYIIFQLLFKNKKVNFLFILDFLIK